MFALTRNLLLRLAAAGLAFLGIPAAAHAQIFYNDLPLERSPIDPADPLVGQPLPNATPAEARAGLVWNMRSGLNAAALSCQFSKYLRLVDNYNAILAHHSGELATAYRTLNGYFTRLGGAREGQRKFDQWSTLTYNNFTTFTGQNAFCQVASDVAKEMLTRPKGEFFEVARNRMREMRLALRASPVDTLWVPGSLNLPPLPPAAFGPVCTGLTGRALQQCQAQ